MPESAHLPPQPLALPPPPHRPRDTRAWYQTLRWLGWELWLLGLLLLAFSIIRTFNNASGLAVLRLVVQGLVSLWLIVTGSRLAHHQARLHAQLSDALWYWDAGGNAFRDLQQRLPAGWQVTRLEPLVAVAVGPATRHLLCLVELQHSERIQQVLDQGDVRVHSWVPSAEQTEVQRGGVQLGGNAAVVAEQLAYWDEVVGRDRARRQAGVDTEREAVEALQRTAPPGWRVQAGLLMTGGGDIDALLTGPAGERWVVEVKSHRGAPSMKGGVLFFGADEKNDVLVQVQRQAREADAWPIVWQPLADYVAVRLDRVTFVAGEVAIIWQAATDHTWQSRAFSKDRSRR